VTGNLENFCELNKAQTKKNANMKAMHKLRRRFVFFTTKEKICCLFASLNFLGPMRIGLILCPIITILPVFFFFSNLTFFRQKFIFISMYQKSIFGPLSSGTVAYDAETLMP